MVHIREPSYRFDHIRLNVWREALFDNRAFENAFRRFDIQSTKCCLDGKFCGYLVLRGAPEAEIVSFECSLKKLLEF